MHLSVDSPEDVDVDGASVSWVSATRTWHSTFDLNQLSFENQDLSNDKKSDYVVRSPSTEATKINRRVEHFNNN